MRIITFQNEIFVLKIKNRSNFWVDAHPGKRPWGAFELDLGLLYVVLVEVQVPEGVDEVAGFQSADLGHHHRKERIARDIEWDAQKDVRASLIELA